MLKKEKNNIDMLIREANKEGCSVIREIHCGNKDFAFITDMKSILVASEDGHIIIPVEVIPEFIDSLKLSTLKAIEYADYITMADKEQMAREKNLTYGKLKGKLFQAAEYCSRTYY